MSGPKRNTSVEEDQTDATGRRAKGEFVRGVSGFRHSIGSAEYPAEPGRYHLFVALNCPWCHRVTLARSVLGLQKSISMDVAFPGRTDQTDPAGPNFWTFDPTRVATLTGAPLPECTNETGTGKAHRLVRDIYADQGSTEQSVPVLFDKTTKQIVNNESAEIIRILNRQAAHLGSTIPERDRPDLYPPDDDLRRDIDAVNEEVYVAINNGAYKAGFSSDQAIYTAAFDAYFDALASLETRLSSDNRPFLIGDRFTEADLRLFPTLYRHDPVYYVRMKLNAARILDYPHLWKWVCRVYALPGVAESSALTHCRQGYFGRSWNNVIPLGPLKPLPYPEAYRHPDLSG
ncbi:MAG: glutathione S-transferase C-terminal domain-containing protein [Pseudomonadota bacterium]